MIATAHGAYKARTAVDLGADVAIDASTADFGELAKAEGGMDMVLDMVGGTPLRAVHLSQVA